MTINDDTIIAPATVPGTGAISLIRISGPRSLELADKLVTFRKGDASSCAGNRIKLGTVYHNGEPLDDVLVCIYRAPLSYTGEDSVELMCHASSYIVSTLIEMAITSGARLALPGEFTQRSFLNGKMDLAQAEAVADVVASSSEASHRVALSQLKGGFSAELSALREKLLKMATLLELELDFSEEDVEFADRKQLISLVDEVLAKVNSLASSFKLGNAIKNGIGVAIVGETNAGKSTLLNAILGEERAIVSDIAGTTRDTIEETFNVDGILFRFVDTAGIRKTEGQIERIGIERSFNSIQKAEIVIVVLDGVTLSNTLSSNTTSDFGSLKAILQVIDFQNQKVFFAINKADIANICEKYPVNNFVTILNKVVSLIENKGLANDFAFTADSIVEISAKQGTGVPALLSKLSEYEKQRLSSVSRDSILVTNLRHFEALTKSANYLSSLRLSLTNGTPSDLVAEDLRASISSLGTITGTITTNEILGEIFGKFCIGK